MSEIESILGAGIELPSPLWCNETFNRMPCPAHTLQLSAKQAIQNTAVQSSLESILDTLELFRMSGVGASIWGEFKEKTVFFFHFGYRLTLKRGGINHFL